jgi:hypothetical protein
MRILLILTLFMAGCGPTAVPEKSDFAMRELILGSTSDQSGEIYEITGHGKRCYVAGFGVSKTLLWCEDEPKVTLIPPIKVRAAAPTAQMDEPK